MKTSLLIILAFAIGISVSAQKIVQPSSAKAKITAEKQSKLLVDEPISTPFNYSPGYYPKSAPGVMETPIGMTLYDLQSNSSVQNRIYAYPDGTVGAVWTMGMIPGTANAFTDRGTGYNYFDGTSWGEFPSARIASQTLRNGWPSYAPLGDGEMIISHTANDLYLTQRPAKGTGDWTSALIPNTTSRTWPRAITNGNTIHLIVSSYALYEGLNTALLYYRSTDAGATFTGPTIIPGLEATALPLHTNFVGFGGDSYSWAAPRGDTLAFVVTDGWGGVFAFKSFDNGTTWTKIVAYSFPNDIVSNVAYGTQDDNSAIAIDKHGKVHLALGRMVVIDTDVAATGSQYRPYTDGLLYWNEDMPALDTTQLMDPDLLWANGNWIASMVDYSGNDTIDFPEVGTDQLPFGKYEASMSSMPQIAVDDNDNIFVSFSQVREDLVNTGAEPNVEMYRHLFLTSKMASEGEWIEPRDLTDDIEHAYDECVFASMSHSIDDKLHFIYQVDPEPGMSLRGDLDATLVDTYQNYLTFPTFVSVKPVDAVKDVVVSPNPANDFANVQILLNSAQKVVLNVYDVMGKLVMNTNFGEQTTGYHTYKVNTSSLPAGIYVFTIQAGASQSTKKVIVN